MTKTLEDLANWSRGAPPDPRYVPRAGDAQAESIRKVMRRLGWATAGEIAEAAGVSRVQASRAIYRISASEEWEVARRKAPCGGHVKEYRLVTGR